MALIVARALIFDMDGLLVDSEPVWWRVEHALCAEHGCNWTDELALAFCTEQTNSVVPGPQEGEGVPSPNPSLSTETCTAVALAGVKEKGIDQFESLCLFDLKDGRTASLRANGLTDSTCALAGGHAFQQRPDTGNWDAP